MHFKFLRMNKYILSFTSALLFFTISKEAVGQNGGDPSSNSEQIASRVINTAVPFLIITPDSRSGGMANAGAAISPDANAVHWNNAKLAFLESDYGFSLSYTPWLSRLINDMSISYLAGYYKISDFQTVAISMRYFDLGKIQLIDMNKALGNEISPKEYSFDGTYSMKLSENLGVGITGRFIYSDISEDIGTDDASPGTSVAADIGVYYNSNPNFRGNLSNIAFAAHISNIGRKLSYNSSANRDFLPTNLRLGTAYTTHFDPYNKITLALDFNKLLVPTLPDTANETTMLGGMFKSFTDAPDGFSEELKEIGVSIGAEYWYNNLFAARLGYSYEHPDKGSWQYFTVGLGFRYQVFGVDFAYLVPTGEENPLGETLRFSLLFNFDQGNNPR